MCERAPAMGKAGMAEGEPPPADPGEGVHGEGGPDARVGWFELRIAAGLPKVKADKLDKFMKGDLMGACVACACARACCCAVAAASAIYCCLPPACEFLARASGPSLRREADPRTKWSQPTR